MFRDALGLWHAKAWDNMRAKWNACSCLTGRGCRFGQALLAVQVLWESQTQRSTHCLVGCLTIVIMDLAAHQPTRAKAFLQFSNALRKAPGYSVHENPGHLDTRPRIDVHAELLQWAVQVQATCYYCLGS